MSNTRLTKEQRQIQSTLSFYLLLAKRHSSSDKKEAEFAGAELDMDAGSLAKELLDRLHLPELTWQELQRYLEIPPPH